MPLNPTTTSKSRLRTLTSHLTTTMASTTTLLPAKDPITCHVLDTTTGRPAARLIVTLTCVSSSPTSPSSSYVAVTNSDGRISNWDAEAIDTPPISTLISSQPDSALAPGDRSIWQLKFNTGAYYGVEKTFWPWVELTFYVKPGEHYHVPLLLGPFSYTTYRGS